MSRIDTLRIHKEALPVARARAAANQLPPPPVAGRGPEMANESYDAEELERYAAELNAKKPPKPPPNKKSIKANNPFLPQCDDCKATFASSSNQEAQETFLSKEEEHKQQQAAAAAAMEAQR